MVLLRLAGGEAENAERRERESALGRREWKSPLKRLPKTLAEYIAEERSRLHLHPDPSPPAPTPAQNDAPL